MKKKIIIIGIVIVICIITLNVSTVIKDRVREKTHEKNIEYFQQENADAEISYTVDSEADNIQSYIIWNKKNEQELKLYMVVIDDHKNKRTLNIDLDEPVHDTRDMELETATYRWEDAIQKESFKELEGKNCISGFSIYVSKNDGNIRIRVVNEKTKKILYDETK